MKPLHVRSCALYESECLTRSRIIRPCYIAVCKHLNFVSPGLVSCTRMSVWRQKSKHFKHINLPLLSLVPCTRVSVKQAGLYMSILHYNDNHYKVLNVHSYFYQKIALDYSMVYLSLLFNSNLTMLIAHPPLKLIIKYAIQR